MVACTLNPGILGIVLAGGRSSRFGTNKAEAMLCGKSLLDRVCERAAPQVQTLLINRNDDGNHGKSRRFETLPDAFPGEGPLAGVLAGLARARDEGYAVVATFPCDTPLLPRDTVASLYGGLTASHADICVAKHNAAEQFAVALWRVSCAPVLLNAFSDGLRSIRSAQDVFSTVAVEFPSLGEGPDGNAFFNINTTSDFAHAEQWLRAQAVSAE